MLTALTPSSPDLQKLVAFENAFDRIFGIIDAEGSLTHGGIVVQDCLSLLANLLRLNGSNQSYFRETGWVRKLADMLSQAIREQNAPDGIADWARPQRDKNLWGLLAVLRLFLIKGSVGTQANQISFWQSGVLAHVLDISFHDSIDMTIRAEVKLHSQEFTSLLLKEISKALATSADLIRGNSGLQEGFAQLEVLSPHDDGSSQAVNGHAKGNETPPTVNVLSGLLDLSLKSSSLHAFNLRISACECIKAYLYDHVPIRLHFLRRAIEGHTSHELEADNILTILISDSESGRSIDPYRPWIAAVLLFHLLYDNFDAKNIAMKVAEGDAEEGEEVVTCIQALSGNLISTQQKGENERVSIGYLMVLCGWLYEDHDAVNDFLGEGSNVQSIIQLISQSNQSKTLVSGLYAFLLGIVYEFSTKDSPIPRATLHQILTTRLGREQYADRITKLREHIVVRDFEVLPQNLGTSQSGGLPDVYFDRTFVDFLKDNFSRIIRAIDRDPGIEIPVVANGIQKGISREMVDSLKAQLDDRTQIVQQLESEKLTVEHKLGQEQADHRKAKESAVIQLCRIKSINEALQRNHEEDSQRIINEHRAAQLEIQKSHDTAMQALRDEMKKSREESEASATRIRARTDAEIADLKATIRKLENELEKSSKDHVQDLQTAHEEYSTKLSDLESRLQRAEDKARDAEDRTTRMQGDLDAKEQARKTVQTELDDLLMVLGDLEEKRARDKVNTLAHSYILIYSSNI